MRPVNKFLFKDNKITYKPYGDAKDDLILALGNFCSYCERQGYSSALDVEHIYDKKSHTKQEYFWNNFLLACKNCNPTKGTKSVENTLLPHVNNTFYVFLYLESGFVIINPNLKNPTKEKAENLLNLVGLDRTPYHKNYSPKDKRWQERKEVWTLTQRYLSKYENNFCDIETIIDLALAKGFWSIWMTTFQDYSEIQEALIKSFAGTNRYYF
jgi:uncharacterized protein (TIGR02646 family)